MKLFPVLVLPFVLAVLVACSSSGAGSRGFADAGGAGGDGAAPGADGGSSSSGSGSGSGSSSGGGSGSSSGSGGGSGSSSGSSSGGGTVPVGTTAVTIIVEPSGDRGQALITAIDAAKTSVHMEMYLLTNDSVVSALTSKASAGVAVQVILNETFPTTDDSNTSVYSTLKAAKGVDVVWASDAFTYTHEKTVIIDGATAWIMTANATEASYDSNREYLAVDTDPTDVAEAEAIFADDFAQSGYKSDSPTSTPTVPGPLVVAPAPPMNSLPDLVALIGSAKQSVYAEVEEIDNTSIANAFVTAVKNGATVDFVVANLSENTSGNAALTTITSGGGHVYIGGAPEATSTATDPYIHAKAIVIDGTKAWIGSENFTTGSLEYNREVGVVFTTPAQVLAVQTAIKSDVASGTALQ